MQNRSKNEIIAAILEVINRGGSTTRNKIMYGAFISYKQLNEYLIFLLENDLISRQPQKTKQSATSF